MVWMGGIVDRGPRLRAEYEAQLEEELRTQSRSEIGWRNRFRFAAEVVRLRWRIFGLRLLFARW